MDFNKKETEMDENFVKEQAEKVDEKDLELVIEKEEALDKKISNSGMLKKYAELGKLFINMLKDYKDGVYRRVPWFTIAAVTFTLLYILNPFDMVPDFIPGLGYLDDLGVFALVLRFVETDLHSYLDWKLEEEE